MTLAKLKSEYDSITSLARQFAEELSDQLKQLLDDNNVFLSIPIQSRVKKWKSITEKIKRRSLSLSEVKNLSDLVGLRLVLLFKRDVNKVCRIISSSLKVIDREDTQDRLREDQFGYTSPCIL
jgi:putative GTP pyrophosphokinase